MKTLNWGKLKSWSWEWRCWQKNFRKQIRLLTSWALSQAKTQNLSRKTSITLKCPLVQAKPNLWNTKGKTQQSQQKRGRMAGLWLNPMRVWCQLERQLCVKIIQLMPQMKLKMRSLEELYRQSTWWRRFYRVTWVWGKQFKSSQSWLTSKIVRFSNFKMRMKTCESDSNC